MNIQFADTLRKLRIQKGLTQSQLANLMFVNKATISKWESGSRLPDAAMIIRHAEVLRVDVKKLLSATAEINESFNIIMVDDNKVILSYNQLILEEVAPNAAIASFSRPQKAIEYAKKHRTDLAFLDIEMGVISGFDLCRELLEINPGTKVVFLTAYPEYSLNAWDTDACGFMVKPLIPEDVRRQLKKWCQVHLIEFLFASKTPAELSSGKLCRQLFSISRKKSYG